MKRNIFLLCVLFFFSCAVSVAQTAKIEFKENTYDFGKVPEEGGNISHQFVFTNTGSAPVIIQGVSTSCGCTASEWSSDPVLPGKTGHITATYSPMGRPRGFVKSLTVRSNAEPSTHALFIKGYVIPRVPKPEEIFSQRIGMLGMKMTYISLDKVPSTEKVTKEVEVHNFGETMQKIQFSDYPAYCTITPKSLTVQANETARFTIAVDGARCEGWDYHNFPVRAQVGETVEALNIAYTRVQDFSKLTPAERANAPVAEIDSKVFHFESVRMGETISKVFTIKNMGKSPLRILNLKPSCSCITAKADDMEVKPGKQTNLRVSFNSNGYSGRQNKRVYMTLNAPNLNKVTIVITGIVD